MNIDASVGKHIEYIGRQDESVGSNDHRIGTGLGNAFDDFAIPQRRRLRYGQSVPERELLDLARDHFQSAPGRPIRLSQYQYDFVLTMNKRFERDGGKGGRTGKYQAH